jgi:dihydrolipoamide dehydrogenase
VTAPLIETDVAVIGAGTAGMSAYRAALHHTPHVLLIERHVYGTTCARVGCMPSKLLIAAADAAHTAAGAARFGVHVSPITIDGRAVMARVRSERDRFVGFVVDAVQAWPAENRLHGHARFLDDHTLQVGDQRVHARRIVIATGSRPAVPDGWRAALGDRLLVNDDVFSWTDLPASLAVVGTGVIGLELAQALHRLGVRVRLYGRSPAVGPLTDPALQALSAQVFAAELPMSTDLASIEPRRDGDAVVVRAVWADVLVLLKIRFVQNRLAGGTLDPQALGHAAALGGVGRLNLGGEQFFEPAHESLLSGKGYGIRPLGAATRQGLRGWA